MAFSARGKADAPFFIGLIMDDAMVKVWLLTDGDGSDGNEWGVVSIHATEEGAERAKVRYETEDRRGVDGSIYHYRANEIEERVLED